MTARAMPELLTFCVAAPGIFLIAFMRGAFGEGFAIIGIPLLSPPLTPTLSREDGEKDVRSGPSQGGRN